MEYEENVFVGLMWGTLFSLPLWAAVCLVIKVLL